MMHLLLTQYKYNGLRLLGAYFPYANYSRVPLALDAQEEKGAKGGYETGRVTGRLVALTGAPLWLFTRSRVAERFVLQ